MGVALIYLFAPISKLIWAINGENFLIEDKTYEEIKHTFKNTYYNHHPIYK